MESPRSPKRRRILSSINPPDPTAEDEAPRACARDRTMTPDVTPDVPQDNPPDQEDAHASDRDPTSAPKTTRFRFKSKSSRSSRSRRERERGGEDEDEADADRHRRHRHRRHRSRSRSRDRDRDKDRDRDRDDSKERRHRHRRRHHHHHHHRRHHSSRSRSPRRRDQQHQQQRPTPPPPFPPEDPPLSPTTAFRESLFDAMADDEGAAYWQSVYGQPIHIYPDPSSSSSSGTHHHLERMTDDEYAAYVRQKMWEKTHAGLLEARERRARERDEERRQAGEREAERRRVEKEMERCLRRGEERRTRRVWRARWEGYLERWRAWEEKGKGEGIPWPWPWCEEEDEAERKVEGEAVRAFFVNGIGLEEVGEKEFAARLKEERVRWHPDKMQQRLGGKVDEKVMRDVTAIFQAVDALWNDTRKNGG